MGEREKTPNRVCVWEWPTQWRLCGRDCSWLLRKKIRGQLRDSVVKASQPTPNRLRTQVCERDTHLPYKIWERGFGKKTILFLSSKAGLPNSFFEKKVALRKICLLFLNYIGINQHWDDYAWCFAFDWVGLRGCHRGRNREVFGSLPGGPNRIQRRRYSPEEEIQSRGDSPSRGNS